jgi:acyl-CoA dehydrogenase
MPRPGRDFSACGPPLEYLLLHLDDDFLLEEHRQFRDQLRKFIAREVVPHAPQWEAAGLLPRELYRQMGDLGFLGLAIPAEFGGSGLDARGTVVFGEELGRSGFGGFAASVADHADMAAPVIVRTGSDEQKRRWLPDIASGRKVLGFAVTEPGGGSDLTRMKATARRNGDQWLLNGHKTFITNAISADVFITIARTDPDATGANGFSIFFIEKGDSGFTVGKPFEKTGWCASDMSELFFDDFAVPAGNLLGEEGRGFYAMMRGLERERMSMAAQCVGMMERALTITLEHVKSRAAYGRTLWDLQAIRHELAGYAGELSAAKLLLYHAAAKKDRGESVRLETSMLKAQVPQMLKRVADGCVQIHGASGYMRGTEIERIFRDARPFSLGGGAAAVMLDEVAKLL